MRARNTVFTLLCTLATFSSQVLGDDGSELSLDAHLSYGYGRQLDSSMQAELRLLPEAELSLSGGMTLRASARIRVDAFDNLEPGRVPDDGYSPASRPLTLGTAGSAEIRDLFLQRESAGGLFRIGKQQIVWGRLDGIKVLDVANLQSFREFVLDDFGESRISLWSAYFDYSLGDWRAELALIPDSTGHEIPAAGAWFELTAPRFRFGAAPGSNTPPIVAQRPGLSLAESAAGVRLSRRVGGFSFSVVAASGLDPEPLGRVVVRAAEPVVERYFERRTVVGASFDIGLGAAVVRGEYGYQPDRSFNLRTVDALAAEKLDQHRGAIGIDLNGPAGTFLNIQYLVDTVRDAPDALVRPPTDRIGTLYVRRAFFYDRLLATARWYYSFTDEDEMISADISYETTSGVVLSLSAQFFSGSSEGLFGQFADRDRLVAGVSYFF